MRLFKNIALILLTLAGLSTAGFCLQSCGKTGAPKDGRPIKVKVVEVETKSQVLTTAGLKTSDGFLIQAFVGAYKDYSTEPVQSFNPWESADKYYFQDRVTFHNGQWEMGDHKWISNTPTSFWCWAPLQANGTMSMDNPSSPNAKDRVFHYSMVNGTSAAGVFTDADKSDDLVFSFREQNFDGSNQDVNLAFRHALSQISFCVSPDDGKYDKKLKIVSIALENIPTRGDCTIHGTGSKPEDCFEWNGLGSTATVKQTYDVYFKSLPSGWTSGSYTSSANTYTLYSSLNNFFIIPHQMDGDGTAGTQLVVVFDDDGEKFEVKKPISDLVKPGYYYKYKINAKVIGRTIDLGVSLVDWREFDDRIFIEN